MGKLIHEELTYEIKSILFDVYNKLGPMLPEEFYERAIGFGLAKRGIPFTAQEEFHVYYKGVEVGRYRTDLFVDRKVILELKVAPELLPLHRAQILSYLKVTGADLGMLVNFGGPSLEDERFPNFLTQRRSEFSWHPAELDKEWLLYPNLVGVIYEGLHRVHYEMGPGFFHHVYRRATMVELNDLNIPYEFKRHFDVYYEDNWIGKQECRLLIADDRVLVAPVALKEITEAERVRFKAHLRRFGLKLGLLANFHGTKLSIEPIRIG